MLRVADEFHGSHTGRQRRANEDNLYARAPLYAVADGMGGAQAGEIASQIAVETLASGGAGGLESVAGLADLIRDANGRIHDLAQSDERRAGMGTTVTAVLLGEDELHVAHVGDSRAYLFREGGLEKLTRDHSLVDELLRQGKLTPEEAREHPQRSVITRAVGPESDVEVDTDTWQMKDGDLLLVCSDGLTTMIGEDVIAGILATSRGVRDAGQALIDAANDAGGRDNITVILLRLEEVGGGTAAVAEQETSAGDATLRTADVQAALEAQRRERTVATMEPLPRRAEPASRRIEPVAPSGPSRPGAGRRPRSPRLRKLFIALIAATIVGFPLIGGAFLAIRSVYFVGADDQGYVAVFRGLPYELPFGVELYQKNYVTPVTRDAVPEARRQAVLEEQKLRSQDDAYDLVAALERGEVDR